MSGLAAHMKAIMLVSGVLTCTKAAFIGLVLAQGGRYLSQQAVVAVVLDSVMVGLFVAYLAGTRDR